MADVVNMPKLGFDMAEGTLIRWVILEDQEVEKNAVLAEIETDKATVEVESTFGGTVLKHLVAEGAIVPVGLPIAVIGTPGEEVDLDALGIAEAETDGEVEPAVEMATGEEHPSDDVQIHEAEGDPNLPEGVRVSPLARRMANERGIDLKLVRGSGPAGRIVKVDIENYQPVVVDSAPSRIGDTGYIPAFIQEPRPDIQIPMSRLRSAIGRRMVTAKQQVPHFYVSYEYNMAKVMDLRKQINSVLPEGERISVNDFILKATALGLRAYPNLNASVDLEKNEVVHHGQINVGVAVAVENGLLTVVCKNTDFKSLRQISAEVRTMAGRAREGKVRPDDIEGSTISSSNLGMFGVEEFLAIINPPEAAILAVGAVRQVPVVENDEIKPGLRMKATISVDHRVSDGAEAAQYMQYLAQFFDEPFKLLI